jgi:kumamolisin
MASAIPTLAVERQTLSNHVPPAIARLGLQPIGRLAATNQLRLAIGLPLRNTNELARLLRDVSDPASSQFRRYLKPDQFAERFGPAKSDYQSLIRFVQEHGLKVTDTHPNRVVLDVAGSVAEIENTFYVKMFLYQHPREPRTFYAADTEPSVDASLSVPILSISGLDDYSRPHPSGLHSMLANGPSGAKPDVGSGPGGGYLSKDFRAAYVPVIETWLRPIPRRCLPSW